jgi:hypothetical protein
MLLQETRQDLMELLRAHKDLLPLVLTYQLSETDTMRVEAERMKLINHFSIQMRMTLRQRDKTLITSMLFSEIARLFVQLLKTIMFRNQS